MGVHVAVKSDLSRFFIQYNFFLPGNTILCTDKKKSWAIFLHPFQQRKKVFSCFLVLSRIRNWWIKLFNVLSKQYTFNNRFFKICLFVLLCKKSWKHNGDYKQGEKTAFRMGENNSKWSIMSNQRGENPVAEVLRSFYSQDSVSSSLLILVTNMIVLFIQLYNTFIVCNTILLYNTIYCPIYTYLV